MKLILPILLFCTLSYGQLDWNNQDTHFFVDTANMMMIVKNAPWNPNGDSGTGDAISRNLMCYIAYDDYRFVEGIKDCFEYDSTGRLIGHRYPDKSHPVGISRDHVTAYVLTLAHTGEDYSNVIDGIKWRLSDVATCTPDMWAWLKAMNGSKFWHFTFYLMEAPTLRFSRIWNRHLYRKMDWGEEWSQDEWENKEHPIQTEKDIKTAKRRYPEYALFTLAEQLELMPDTKRKEKMQEFCLTMTPKHNYALKLILGDTTVTQEQIDSYRPMKGGRWTGIMIPKINRRGIEFNYDEWNVYDKDYLNALWERHEKQKD